jgi:hypothetical protein
MDLYTNQLCDMAESDYNTETITIIQCENFFL